MIGFGLSDDGNWVYGDYTVLINQEKIKNFLEVLDNLEINNTELYDNYSIEKLVTITKPSRLLQLPREDVIKEDRINGIQYSLSKPSFEYILSSFAFMMQTDTSDYPGLFTANFLLSPMHRDRIQRAMENFERSLKNELRRSLRFLGNRQEILLEELFHKLFGRVWTVQIKTEEELELSNFHDLYNSFLFYLNYINLPYIEFRYVKNDFRDIQRVNVNDMAIPRRIYNREPLYYYHQAISAENPVLIFLSYYQVLENYYKLVSDENLFKGAKNIIANPEFSSENNYKIEKLINFVKGAENRYNEKYSLKLVLEKYLDVNELNDDLRNYDGEIYEHIFNEKLEFVDVPKLPEINNLKFKKSLANRIYNIRNALIHSKEGVKQRYVPFSEHEIELRKNLPLMRLTAEQVLIKSAENLNIHTLRSKSDNYNQGV